MLTLLSPAKALDYKTRLRTKKVSQPRMTASTEQLVSLMASKQPDEIGALMDLSADLAMLNFERFQDWDPTYPDATSRPALLAFAGDAYLAMDIARFGERDYTHAQKHLRILSGLYGVLRPLDRIQPYRLEMGTKLAGDHGTNLYQFWGRDITDSINRDLDGRRHPVVINLASTEYFKSVRTEDLDAPVVTPVFKDFSRDEYRVVGYSAKRARGMMAAWMILNRISSRRMLMQFAEGGYRYSPDHSTPSTPTYIRQPSVA